MNFSNLTNEELIDQLVSANNEYLEYIRKTPVERWDVEFDGIRRIIRECTREMQRRNAYNPRNN